MQQEQNPSFPSSVRLIPRHRFAFNSPIVYSYDMLKARFHMRLPDAAKSLGISETTLKHVCRKLGIARWPRRFQNKNFAETEGAQASGSDPRGSANSDGVADSSHSSEKRKRSSPAEAGQSTSSRLQPHLPHHTSAQVPHVQSFLQQQSMVSRKLVASHQLLATQRQAAAGRGGFMSVVDGSVVGVQMPSLSGQEGVGRTARTAWRVDTGVFDTLGQHGAWIQECLTRVPRVTL